MLLSIAEQVRNLSHKWFAPRELIIRTETGVHYFRFTRKRQMSVAIAGVLIGMGLLGTSFSTALMTVLWQERGGAVQELQLAYSGLIDTMQKALSPEEAKFRPLLERSQGELGAQFSADLEATRKEASSLRKQVQELSALLEKNQVQLENAQENSQKLFAQIASLNRQATVKNDQGLELQGQLQKTSEALKESTERQHEMEMAKNAAENALRETTERLDTVRAAHANMMANLAQRTHSSSDEIEKTVSMTGLDVKGLLLQVDEDKFGQGGPFVPDERAANVVQDQMIQHVASLDDQVTRMEKLQVILHSLPLSAPVDRYYVSSGFGERADPFNGEEGYHTGLDMVGTLRSEVLSTAPGKVVFAGWRGNYGKVVEIDHGFGVHTVYAHLFSISVEVGAEVGYRQIIGLLGSTGRSSGPHVHYEVRYHDRPINPNKFLQAGRYVFKG